MGGSGSGRRYQGGKYTTDDMRTLDVRHLQREGILTPGRISSLDWWRRGSVIADTDHRKNRSRDIQLSLSKIR